MLKDKTERHPAVSKSMECDMTLLMLTPLAGRQEGHLACKKFGLGTSVVTI